MQLRELREFVVFAKYLNFSHAASELHMSQSTLSTHIADLEKDLRMLLVNRRGRISLTYAGRRYLEGAQRAIAVYDETLADCRSMTANQAPVRLATTEFDPLFPWLVSRAQASGIPFELVEVPRETYGPLGEVEHGVVDLACCYDFEGASPLAEAAQDAGVASYYLRQDPVVICMMQSHPLASKAQLTRADIDGEKVAVITNLWFDFLSTLYQAILGDGCHVTYHMLPIGSPLSMRYIDLGDLITFCGSNTQQLTGRDDVVSFDTLDGEPMSIRQDIVWIEGNRNPNVERLAYFLTECE